MRRNPLYVFNDLLSVGIYDVPLESMVQINDRDGSGKPDVVQIIAKTGLNPSSTIAEFLADPSLYKDNTPNEMKLDDLVDAELHTPHDGEILSYDSQIGQWVNAAAISGGTF